MTGFFDLKKVKSKSNVRYTCASCGLYRNVLSPRMEPYGEFTKGILNCGEAGGSSEDKRGKPWVGEMGQVLQRAYEELDFHLFKDCVNINACSCRPIDSHGNNRTPTNNEIAACRSRVFDTIHQYKPHVIVLLGGSALESILGNRWLKDLGTISKWRGWTIPDRELNAWLCITFHPSFVERKAKEGRHASNREIQTVWMQDLKRALNLWNVPLPVWEDESRKVRIIDDLSCLDDVGDPFATDYETTGIKPHLTEHRIICQSVADAKHTWVFMYPEPGSKNMEYLRRLMCSNRRKIAQNMKFEYSWTLNKMGMEVTNWLWDPMLATHVLDNRPGICSLKFQVYVQFGVLDYSSEVDPYLKGDDKNANSFNRITELIRTESGRRKLLIYCGLDSRYEYDLAMKQMKELGA